MTSERRFIINLGGISDTDDSDEENHGFTLNLIPGEEGESKESDCPELSPMPSAVPATYDLRSVPMPLLEKETSAVTTPMVINVKIEWDSYTAYLTTPGIIDRGLVSQIERVLRENAFLLEAGIAIIVTPGPGDSSDAASKIHFLSDTGLEIMLVVDKLVTTVKVPKPLSTTSSAGGGGQPECDLGVNATPKKTAAVSRLLQQWNYSYTEERWGDEDEGYFTKDGKKCASPVSRGNRPCPRRELFPKDTDEDVENSSN